MSKKTNSQAVRDKHRWNFKTDIPLTILFLLAFLSMPRVVLHDLKLMPFDSFFYLFTAIAPLLVYLAIAIFRDNKRPIYDFFILGVFYGVLLALVHLLLWDVAGSGHGLAFGDNLTGVMDPSAEALAFKVAVAHSSVFTGVGIGLILGLISKVAQKVKERRATN
jgi:hypothetical protein